MKEKRLLRKLLDEFQDYGVLAIDPQGRVFFVNRYAEELFGLDREVLLKQNIWEIHRFRLRDPEILAKALSEAQEQGEFSFSFPYEAQGQKRLYKVRLRPLKEADQTIGFLVTFKDETQVTQHQRDLEEKEALLEILARASRLLIEKDRKKAVSRFLDLLQKASSLEQILLLESVAGEYLVRASAPRLRRGRLPKIPAEIFPLSPKPKAFFLSPSVWPFKYQGLWAQRGLKEFYVQPVLAGERPWGLLIIGAKEREELERRREIFSIAADLIGAAVHREALEEQFFQAQKMESIAQLAGGLAHNFNNLLTIILGNLERSRLNLGPEALKYLDEIESCTMRAAELIRQLLIFSTENQGHTERCNLNEILAEIEDMLQVLASEEITLSLEAEAAWEIKADKLLIEQMILNLVTNARDAMPQGGEILIRTRNEWLSEVEAEPLGLSPGPYVVLEVADTGEGMDEETKQKIFDAFFTTKEPGKGTGLGLSMVYGAVKHLGGTIQVQSAPGQGTSFRLYFPALEAQGLGPEEDPSLAQTAPQKGLKILLIEDEDFLREHLRDVLIEQGHQVCSAKLPREALDLFAEKGPFTLLITDVSLPGVSGKRLAELFLAHDPALKVLFISGFPEKVVKPLEGTYFLQKPFKLKDLLEKIEEIRQRLSSEAHWTNTSGTELGDKDLINS